MRFHFYKRKIEMDQYESGPIPTYALSERDYQEEVRRSDAILRKIESGAVALAVERERKGIVLTYEAHSVYCDGEWCFYRGNFGDVLIVKKNKTTENMFMFQSSGLPEDINFVAVMNRWKDFLKSPLSFDVTATRAKVFVSNRGNTEERTVFLESFSHVAADIDADDEHIPTSWNIVLKRNR